MNKKSIRTLSLGLGLGLLVSSSGVYASSGVKPGPAPSRQPLIDEQLLGPVRGDLNNDGTSWIVEYRPRNMADQKDPGYLVASKMVEGRAQEVDKISLDFSNRVLDMKIGRDSRGENLLYVVSSEGAHAFGIRLFRLRDNKLEDVINRKKLVLSSQLKPSKIEDINGDGSFEFSISRQDPILSSPEKPVSLDLWYSYNGADSAQLVRLDREQVARPGLKGYQGLLDQGKYGQAYDYLKDQAASLSRAELDQALRTYILSQDQELVKKNSELGLLLDKYKIQAQDQALKILNQGQAFEQSQLYRDQPELRSYLLGLRGQPYYFQILEGAYNLRLDYGRLLNFGPKLGPDLISYLGLMDQEVKKRGLSEEDLAIPMEEMAERIGQLEKFRLEYPYSDLMGDINQLHNFYLRSYLFSSLNQEDEKLGLDQRKKFEKAAKDYDYLPLSNILGFYLGQLKSQDFRLDGGLRNKMNQLLLEDQLAYGLGEPEEFLQLKGLDFKEVSRLRPESIANERLEAFLKDYLDYNLEEDGLLTYSYNYIDLNNDGSQELIVYLLGSLVSGSGGDTGLILSSNYQLISEIKLARNPIIVSQTTSGGYRDLIVGYWGGGGPSGYGLLKFDGKAYPNNPSQAPRAQGKIKGLALISNQLYTDQAFELR